MNDDNLAKIWEEKVSIPTYAVGKPDKNPMFFHKRVYQGSSGVVYPNPVIEKIHDNKEEKIYTGLFLENKYIKILILPELGGRVQMAYDKIKERHFIYHNQVIKPALVGLLGPWISGGIEFNWPQHHRPSTFQSVDYKIDKNEDGSVTAWTNEVEIMSHTKGMAGFTIYPDKAYLEINVQLYNRTNLPQSFLWWANPAVRVDENYQSVFPPDVNAVFDHGKRDVVSFPIAKGTYYKVDYSPGTDISRYKNIPVPTSYMAIQSDYDFVGGYEHNTEAGLLHVANHHVSPGKKQWTWGNGDFGKAWDRNLTDEDGPYIELMTGVYTDNQPDFSWLMPYEEKSFSQYFMPYQKLGVVKNATKGILLNIDLINDYEVDLKIYVTSNQFGIIIRVFVEDEPSYEAHADLSPESVYENRVEVDQIITEENYILIIEDREGKELIRYEPSKNREDKIPKPAKPAKQPEEIESTEQLYLTGLHLEQYRHATYQPELYYKEALKREPKDIRNNNALGKWYLRKGRFEKSEDYFRKAIDTLNERNPNPINGEPYYNLGVCLKFQGKTEEAYSAFHKSAWNSAWQDMSYFSLAEINIGRGEYEQALEEINWSIDRNARNSKAWTLKAAILRKSGASKEALEVTKKAIIKDPFNLSAYFEKCLIYDQLGNKEKADSELEKFLSLSRLSVQNLIAYALDYSSAGLFDEAIILLSQAIDSNEEETYPMVMYYLGWFYYKNDDEELAIQYYRKAANLSPDYCFPNRLQAISVLRKAIEFNAEDAMAPYYLGCLFYNNRQDELAINYWETSKEINDSFPTVHRNLGIAYFNKLNNPEKAIQSFEKAFSLDTSDARVLMELDQLNKRVNKDPEERLKFLEKHIDLVEFRDDLYLERIALYNFLSKHEKAFNLIMERRFHPWEGGEGRVSEQYVYSLTELAKEDIQAGEYHRAVEKLEKALVYPENLGEGKLFGSRENDIFYWMGIAFEQLNEIDKAKECWIKATKGNYSPDPAFFYNDQPADKILYQGLAWKKLGKSKQADELSSTLINYGQKHMNDEVKIDYFAVSLPDLLIFDTDLDLRNKIHCTFMISLGNLIADNIKEAVCELKNILGWQAMHFGAKTHLELVNSFNIET